MAFVNRSIVRVRWIIPGKLTDLVKHLFLIALFMRTVSCDEMDFKAKGETPKEFAPDFCKELQTKWMRDSYLDRDERREYCLAGCEFVKFSCKPEVRSVKPGIAGFDVAGIWLSVESFANDALADKFADYYDGPIFEPPRQTVEAWLELVEHIAPLIGCLFPLLLNQYKYHNFWLATLLTIMQLLLSGYGVMPISMAFHNALFCFLSLASSANSSYLFDSVQTLFWIQMVFFAMFLSNSYWQVFILLVAIVGYFMYLNHIFFVRRSGSHAGIAVVAAQLFVLIEELYFVRSNMFQISLIGAAIEMGLYSAMPFGSSRTASGNILRLSVFIANKFTTPKLKIIVFLILPLLQVFMFLLFRAALGGYYLFTMRYKKDVSTLLAGLYVYMIDVIGPFRCLVRQGFKIELTSERRLLYGFIGSLMVVLEYKYAYDFFLVRLFFTTIDEFFYHSKYGKAMHYLQFNVDFMQVAFPHSRAPAWSCFEKLAEVALTTATLVSRKTGQASKGVGVVLKSGGRAMLYTVRHVVQNCDLIQFQNQTISSPDFRSLTTTDDPVVAMKIEYDDAPEVELITYEEVEYIDHLVFISTSDVDKRNYSCVVPEFHIAKDGTLRAIVNLKKGDSGAPCFAILKDGTVRFCGVVSQGNPRDGGGNIISMCIHTGMLSADSSDDESNKALSIQQFNAVRRVKFKSDALERFDSSYQSMINYLRCNMTLIDTFREWKVPMCYDDVLNPPPYDSLLERFHNDNYVCSTQPVQAAEQAAEPIIERRVGDGVTFENDAGGEGGGPPRARPRWDQKRRNKDKAYRKQAFDTMLALNAFLQGLYSQRDARNIFNAIAAGNMPPLSDREYILDADGKNWMVSDSLMDPEQT